jgi:hypothetical protein
MPQHQHPHPHMQNIGRFYHYLRFELRHLRLHQVELKKPCLARLLFFNLTIQGSIPVVYFLTYGI